MFTPEETNEDDGIFILIANHAIEDSKARQLSIEYNLARIEHGKSQLPERINKCILVYDIRGQRLDADALTYLKASFAHIHELRIWQ